MVLFIFEGDYIDIFLRLGNKSISIFLKSLPYLAAIITGGFFYLLANELNSVYYDLLINISATFIAIPFLYLFYETTKSFSTKKLNREIFDYAKMQIDREIMSTLNQLQKMIYTLDEKTFTTKSITNLLSMSEKEIKNEAEKNKYLGFQIFKNWEMNEDTLHEVLKNPFILEKLENKQVISIIKMLKSIRNIEYIQKIDGLYLDTNEKTEDYIIQNGIELNSKTPFPQRYLLLKLLEKDKFIVWDFGDIPKYNIEKCLNYYKINSEMLDVYSKAIFELLETINFWLESTENEFIVDTKSFKFKRVNNIIV